MPENASRLTGELQARRAGALKLKHARKYARPFVAVQRLVRRATDRESGRVSSSRCRRRTSIPHVRQQSGVLLPIHG
jgi:hypothetical protein